LAIWRRGDGRGSQILPVASVEVYGVATFYAQFKFSPRARTSSWAELLEVEGPYLKAVEAALGERLQALVVDTLADACTAVEHLKQRGAGRAASSRPGWPGQDGFWSSGRRVVPLLSLVKPLPGHEGAVRALLEGSSSARTYSRPWTGGEASL